ncbi:MAG: alpha/beta fold hydrolase [Solirubrobacteraceae bacterium]
MTPPTHTGAHMETVRSADGTTIAMDRSGQGPPLIVVVGAFCDRSASKPLAALLADRYTVLEYDRRGRGDSGDAARYAIEREVEDFDAVVTAAGEPPFVYGHSSGGALALEAAAAGVALRKVAVYEVPYTGRDPGPAYAEALDELAASGRQDEAAERFLALTGAPPEIIASIKASPGWPRMRALDLVGGFQAWRAAGLPVFPAS